MSTKKSNKKESSTAVQIPFVKKNFLVIAGGFAFVVLGFLLMYVSQDNWGKAEVIYSFSKTSLPVLLIMIGFVVTGFGIMKRFPGEE